MLPPLPGIVLGPTVPGPGTVIAPPSLVVTGAPNGSATFDTTPSYTGTATSSAFAVARIEASVDGGAFSTAGVACAGCGTRTASFTFAASPLTEGAHSFGFRALDAAGQSSPTVTRTLTVDTTAPTFNSIAATGSSTSVSATFSESLACSTVGADDFSALLGANPVAVSGVGCDPSSATITLTLGSAPPPGTVVTVTLSGVVSDPAGNVAPRPTARSDTA